ncbi:hypothetical protein BC834DRAFT_818640, partial [Gloeopeniophorella convolvens]
IRQRRDENVNVALMHAGLVPGTPVTPSLAFSVDLLAFYYHLRRRQPSVGVQGFVKSACAVQSFPYVHTLEALFSNAFDVYCDVRRRVQRRVDVALKRDASNWRMKYGCPACGYKLAGETRLVPDRMHAVDGCDSQKRDKAAGTCDERAFESRLFLSRDFVNRFHGEVRSHAAARQSSQASQARVRAVEAEDGFALPEDQEDDRCGSNWKAANTKELPPASKEAFEQTGVFACLCRHGIVEFLIEFVQCGERAKHALAAVSTILEEFGEDQALGYDINCVLETTVRNSSLGNKASELRLQHVVDAFHCWAHKRACQLKYHPLYRPGFGLEDLSTCERFFSSLNGTARNIRHASNYRWHQAIDLHVDQLNDDRYASLGVYPTL